MPEKITLKNCIEFAVVTEDIGARFYNDMARKFSGNQELANLFKALAKDEEVHKKQFSELLNNLPKEAGAVSDPAKTEYLRAMSISEFFSRDAGPFANADKIGNRDDVLEKAFGFEKATFGFYRSVQDVLGNVTALTQVIETEKSHITRLMKIMLTGEKFRSLQDKWY